MRNIVSKATRITWPAELCKSGGDEDKFVINYFNQKTDGYLIDIAAACPVSGSLSYKLLSLYNWSGILVEPSEVHRENIEKCYGDVEGVEFYPGAIHQTLKSVNLYEPDGMGIGCASLDPERMNAEWLDKHSKRNYFVDAMPIMDLFKKYNAPKDIDFMNLDIEGSEGEVLDYFDFDVYNVKLICIEGGDQYGEFMKSKGYKLCDNSGYDLSNDNLFFEKV
tara:strand:+ start:3833 stop:4495 length:663 start_codon:yes stop_codon:yes gene_type:complete